MAENKINTSVGEVALEGGIIGGVLLLIKKIWSMLSGLFTGVAGSKVQSELDRIAGGKGLGEEATLIDLLSQSKLPDSLRDVLVEGLGLFGREHGQKSQERAVKMIALAAQRRIDLAFSAKKQGFPVERIYTDDILGGIVKDGDSPEKVRDRFLDLGLHHDINDPLIERAWSGLGSSIPAALFGVLLVLFFLVMLTRGCTSDAIEGVANVTNNLPKW